MNEYLFKLVIEVPENLYSEENLQIILRDIGEGARLDNENSLQRKLTLGYRRFAKSDIHAVSKAFKELKAVIPNLRIVDAYIDR